METRQLVIVVIILLMGVFALLTFEFKGNEKEARIESATLQTDTPAIGGTIVNY